MNAGYSSRSALLLQKAAIAAARGLARAPVPLSGGGSSLLRTACLGLMDERALHEVTRAHYATRSGFEDEAFNLGGLWPSEEAAIAATFRDRSRVLVAGCGGGREAIALARRGHVVTAFDACPAMVESCRRNAAAAGCRLDVLGSDGAVPSVPEQDAVLVGRGVYHHIPGREQRVRFLASARAALRPGAPLVLLDFFARVEGSHERVRAVAAVLQAMVGPGRRVEVGDGLTECFQHAFTRAEIEGELREAGFELTSYVESHDADGHLAHATARASPA